MDKDIKNICIYGVGGVGGYFGAKMLSAKVNTNYKVSFIARGNHLNEIKNKGIILETKDREIKAFPDFVTDNISEIEEIDLLILCVKSYDLHEVVISLKDKIKEDTIILPLLNGVDIYQRIKSELKGAIVLPSCVYVGTHIKKPGVISQNGGDGRIIFGNDPNIINYYPESVIKCFNDLKLNFKYEETPYTEIWTKYMFISAYGLVTAFTGKLLGEVFEDKELVQDVSGIMQEVKQIAEATGIVLDENIVEESINKATKFPYDTKTSYQRDIENPNKKNEGEIFGGTIIGMGKEYDIRTNTTEKYYMS